MTDHFGVCPSHRSVARGRHSCLAAALATLLPMAAHSQTVPNAGSILQQVQPATPARPAPSSTGLTLQRPADNLLPSSAPFEVKAIQITGNTSIDSATLRALVADAEGQSL